MIRRAIPILTTAFFLLIQGGCEAPEIPTSVKVGPGPSFLLRGSGRLASFTIYAPMSGQKVAFPHTEVSSVVWQLSSSRGYFKGASVNGLDLIYGRNPEGYKQTVP